jgi:hypothetical protein
MMKRFVLAAILVIPTMAVSNLAVAGDPFPVCYPCPPQPPPVAATMVAADAR